jgi:magnesium chelatase subunit D
VVYRRRGLGPLDVCLVIDASASMAGPRMRAAKYLAQHLLLSTRDRVAVVVFQEREAGLYVPFTRNFEAVQRGLARIRPLGLTPLAEGLVQAATYVRRERVRDPLLLLITDGIPTVPRWTMNPIADALAAARALARDRIRFSCIGLEPNLDFLRDLAAGARGTLHVVEELDQALLSEIAHSERRRVRL